jgi:hypothetical protein
MAGQNELAQLEAEGRLLSMIAYHDAVSSGYIHGEHRHGLLSARLQSFAVSGFLVAGVFAGQISASAILFLVVASSVLAYFDER